MAYNPALHHRSSIRLKDYNYSQAASYFITICAHDRKRSFGKVSNDEMMLSEYGTIAHHQWEKLPERFSNVELGVFQIMPDHMHAIITLTVGATLAVAPTDANSAPFVNSATAITDTPSTDATSFIASAADIVAHHNLILDNGDRGAGASPAPTNNATVGAIVGAYKSLTAMGCLEIFKQKYPCKIMGKLWQRNYYEHIIRDEESFQRISAYIINNPKNLKR